MTKPQKIGSGRKEGRQQSRQFASDRQLVKEEEEVSALRHAKYPSREFEAKNNCGIHRELYIWLSGLFLSLFGFMKTSFMCSEGEIKKPLNVHHVRCPTGRRRTTKNLSFHSSDSHSSYNFQARDETSFNITSCQYSFLILIS